MAQDDEGFEIADFGADLSGDEEEGGAGRDQEGPRYDPPTKPTNKAVPTTTDPDSTSHQVRESLDGETIFAVGDEDGDKWSDDEDEDEEDHKKLVENGKSKD